MKLLVGGMYCYAIGICVIYSLELLKYISYYEAKKCFQHKRSVESEAVVEVDSSIEIVNTANWFHIILDSIQSSEFGIHDYLRLQRIHYTRRYN